MNRVARASKAARRGGPSIPVSDRHLGWMGTSTGKKFHPLDPRADEVDVLDVARGLSMVCRYGGQIKRRYCVAEHCVHVASFVHAEYAFEALLHDSGEAFIGDMIRPLKHSEPMRPFRDAEAKIERCVFEALGVMSTAESRAAVKTIDDRILVDEIRALCYDPSLYLHEGSWLSKLEPLGVEFQYWTPEEAEAAFLGMYEALKPKP